MDSDDFVNMLFVPNARLCIITKIVLRDAVEEKSQHDVGLSHGHSTHTGTNDVSLSHRLH